MMLVGYIGLLDLGGLEGLDKAKGRIAIGLLAGDSFGSAVSRHSQGWTT